MTGVQTCALPISNGCDEQLKLEREWQNNNNHPNCFFNEHGKVTSFKTENMTKKGAALGRNYEICSSPNPLDLFWKFRYGTILQEQFQPHGDPPTNYEGVGSYKDYYDRLKFKN